MEPSSITNADEACLLGLIEGARRRVVYVAPGVSDKVAAVLAESWKRLGPAGVQVVIDPDPEVLRLANALSALYPPGSEEKRLLDAMLLGVPRG